jgi:hypothetical protein
VLPSVDAEDGPELADDGVLVGVGADLEAARLGVLNEPGPAGALDAGEGRVEALLEGVEGAVRVVDGAGQSAARGLAAALARGRQVLPEQRVVEVAAAVEVDEGLQGDLGGDVVLGFGFGDLLAEVVVRRHVGVVVVLVVQLHDLARDGGLEGAVVVCGGLVAGISGKRGTALTLQVRQSGLSAHEGGRDASAGGALGSSAERRAQGGGAEESRVHFGWNWCECVIDGMMGMGRYG